MDVSPFRTKCSKVSEITPHTLFHVVLCYLQLTMRLSKSQIYDKLYMTESLSIAVFIWKNSSRTHDLSSFRFLASLTALCMSSISQSGPYNNQIVVGYSITFVIL